MFFGIPVKALMNLRMMLESSKLKLNVVEAHLIIIGNTTTKHDCLLLSSFPVKILGNDTSSSDTILDVGVVYDNDISYHQYISQMILFVAPLSLNYFKDTGAIEMLKILSL